jgi:hypothetical protein
MAQLAPLITQVADDQAGFGECREHGKPGHVDVLPLALCWYGMPAVRVLDQSQVCGLGRGQCCADKEV